MFDDAELQGAYGLFGNEKVTPAEVMAAHYRSTLERVDATEHGRVVLCVQDTTTLEFGGEGHREGLGWVSRQKQGFFAHGALLLSADGSARPLGVIGMTTFMRERPPAMKERVRRKANGKKTCLDPERESLRWSAMADEVTERLRGHAIPIHLSDREADCYEYLSGRISKGQRFVARARELKRPVTVAGEEESELLPLRVLARGATAIATREVVLSRRARSPLPAQEKKHPSREQRVAHLEFAAERVRIARPKHLSAQKPESELEPATSPGATKRESSKLLDAIELNVVHVREVSPPEGVEEVEWLLLTTEPVDTPEELLRVVDYYRARWLIEELHQAIKTGCDYESRQLESAHALLVAFAVCLPIAWQMLALRHQSRVEPDAPASTVISDERLEVLRTIARRALPKHPTVLDVFMAIAALGGHIARNGRPGWKTLRGGLSKLLIVEAAFAARDAKAKRARSTSR